jgi:MBG domain (YGX type)/YDG domain
VVTAPSSATYGQTGLTATASGGSGGGAYSYSAGSSTACSVNASTGAITISAGSGTCAITAARAADDDYNVSSPSAPANVTVGTTAVTVTFTAADKIYDGADSANVSNCVIASGTIGSDDVTCSVSAGTFASANASASAQTVSATATLSGTAAGNYSVANPVTTTAKINAKAASVTLEAASKTYGADDPTFTGLLSGFLAADGVTASYSRAAGETVAGGPYTISATLSPSGVLGNYDITYNTANFTINMATASVTPNDASKTYGADDPTFTGLLSGFLAADGVMASYSRAAGETVAGGPYTISATLSPSGVLGNYDITYDTANFTINPAAAAVTFTAADKIYDGADSANVSNCVIASGNIGSDDVTCSVSAGTFASRYASASAQTVSAMATLGGAAAANYTVANPVTTTATINAKAVDVTADDQTTTSGSDDPVFTFHLSDLADGDSLTGVSCGVSGAHTDAGTYPISCMGNTNTNYAASYVDGTLTVLPAGPED